MSELKVMNKGEKFAHVSVGSLHDFEGKQFVKDATGATSCEISFGTQSKYRDYTIVAQLMLPCGDFIV